MASEPMQVPVLEPGYTYGTVTDKVNDVILKKGTPKGWLAAVGVALLLVLVLIISIGMLFYRGTGIWGINNTIAWGFAIVNLVWWIGIGHAGTLISAILLLFRQEWRTSINRFAEAMTIFAVTQASLFPILHLGRPWLFYWLLPYPNMMGMWPQFRSPLLWDVFAISTYVTVSFLFWYFGLIPDMATLRDQADNKWVKRNFRNLLPGMARCSASLVNTLQSLPPVGCLGYAIGRLRAQCCKFRLCCGPHPRLAHHLPAPILRCRRYLFRLCNGHHSGHSYPQVIWDGGLNHPTAPG